MDEDPKYSNEDWNHLSNSIDEDGYSRRDSGVVFSSTERFAQPYNVEQRNVARKQAYRETHGSGDAENDRFSDFSFTSDKYYPGADDESIDDRFFVDAEKKWIGWAKSELKDADTADERNEIRKEAYSRAREDASLRAGLVSLNTFGMKESEVKGLSYAEVKAVARDRGLRTALYNEKVSQLKQEGEFTEEKAEELRTEIGKASTSEVVRQSKEQFEKEFEAEKSEAELAEDGEEAENTERKSEENGGSSNQGRVVWASGTSSDQEFREPAGEGDEDSVVPDEEAGGFKEETKEQYVQRRLEEEMDRNEDKVEKLGRETRSNLAPVRGRREREKAFKDQIRRQREEERRLDLESGILQMSAKFGISVPDDMDTKRKARIVALRAMLVNGGAMTAEEASAASEEELEAKFKSAARPPGEAPVTDEELDEIIGVAKEAMVEGGAETRKARDEFLSDTERDDSATSDLFFKSMSRYSLRGVSTREADSSRAEFRQTRREGEYEGLATIEGIQNRRESLGLDETREGGLFEGSGGRMLEEEAQEGLETILSRLQTLEKKLEGLGEI